MRSSPFSTSAFTPLISSSISVSCTLSAAICCARLSFSASSWATRCARNPPPPFANRAVGRKQLPAAWRGSARPRAPVPGVARSSRMIRLGWSSGSGSCRPAAVASTAVPGLPLPAASEVLREGQPRCVGLLRLEPCHRRAQCQILVPQHVVLGMRAHILERDQGIARPHPAALSDVDDADDPALEVLHRLPLALRAHDARRHGSTRQRGQPGPQAAAAEEQQHDRPAQKPLPARHRPQRRRRLPWSRTPVRACWPAV